MQNNLLSSQFANIRNILSRFTFQAISNGTFVVDNFFFLSGLLVAYLTLCEVQKRAGRFPFLMYYLHRFLRLTPTYAFVLFFIWFLIIHLADGPLYHFITWEGSGLYQTCSKYWWTNLLYINNFYPWELKDECIGWTWYLANDMQFYIFSPLLLIPLYFLFPLGLAISSGVLTVCFVISGALAGVYDYQANGASQLAYGYAPKNTDATQSFKSSLHQALAQSCTIHCWSYPWIYPLPFPSTQQAPYQLCHFPFPPCPIRDIPCSSSLWPLPSVAWTCTNQSRECHLYHVFKIQLESWSGPSCFYLSLWIWRANQLVSFNEVLDSSQPTLLLCISTPLFHSSCNFWIKEKSHTLSGL